MTKYQSRYIKHQEKKSKMLAQIIKARHSTRQFSRENVPLDVLEELMNVVDDCPSSCDRKAVELGLVVGRDKKALLGGILVGGVGWIHRADKIILIFADQRAYLGLGEIDYMPYLDAGVVVSYLYLKSTELGIKGCFVNPNIREINQEHFRNNFGDRIFCGAFAIGYEK